MAANLNVFKNYQKNCILSKSKLFSEKFIGWHIESDGEKWRYEHFKHTKQWWATLKMKKLRENKVKEINDIGRENKERKKKEEKKKNPIG